MFSLSHTLKPSSSNDVHDSNFDFQFSFFSLCDLQVETCQEQIFSLELEDPKSLESPLTPNSITNIEMALEQYETARVACDDSDDNHSMVTIVPGNNNNIEDYEEEEDEEEEGILYLDQTSSDSSDYINANSTASTTTTTMMTRTLQTIVEVVNPILVGDGSATEIAVGRMTNDDLSLPSFDVDEEVEVDEDGLELSLNDKMKNVLKELKENEKVRLSWSRSMEEDEANVDDEMPEAGGAAYEEKTGSIGTVFMVRERLINDFYDHEHVVNQENIDNCQVISNPSIDEFLAHEIRHATASAVTPNAVERESLTLDLRKTINDDDEDDDDETTTTENTPTTPTKFLDASITAAGSKKRRRNKKSKAKK